jgi:hypothetical protein
MNEFASYYVNQAGNGISVFRGRRYQRGHSFFGRVLSDAVLPIVKSLGGKIFNKGKNFVKNLLDSTDVPDENMEDITKNMKKAASEFLSNTALKLKGSGQLTVPPSRKKPKKKMIGSGIIKSKSRNIKRGKTAIKGVLKRSKKKSAKKAHKKRSRKSLKSLIKASVKRRQRKVNQNHLLF